jgi:hypothetical protein
MLFVYTLTTNSAGDGIIGIITFPKARKTAGSDTLLHIRTISSNPWKTKSEQIHNELTLTYKAKTVIQYLDLPFIFS